MPDGSVDGTGSDVVSPPADRTTIHEDVPSPPPTDRPRTCTYGRERAEISVLEPTGTTRSCATLLPMMPQLPIEVRGVAHVIDETTFEVDACIPGTGCRPQVYRVNVRAPELSARSINEGALVLLRYRASWGFGCTSTLLVEGWSGTSSSDAIRPAGDGGAELRPAFDAGGITPRRDAGVMDPITPTGGRLYLAVSEGTMMSPYAGIAVERIHSGCTPGTGRVGCGPVVPGAYFLRFMQVTRAALLDVEMNNTVTWTLATSMGTQSVRVRNMRSFETGLCDDHWNWSYWIANAR